MLKELVKLANHLDSKGLVKEADYLDRIIKSAEEPSGDDYLCSLGFKNADSESGVTVYEDLEITCTLEDRFIEDFKATRPMALSEVKEKISDFNAKYTMPTWSVMVDPIFNTGVDAARRMPTHEGGPQTNSNPYNFIAEKEIEDFIRMGGNFILQR